MIGTHNSLTGYKPVHWYHRPFAFLWRCQTKTLKEQLEKNVGYFDIRIRMDKDGKIQFCHGLVDLKVPYALDLLLRILSDNNKKCRIIVERGWDFNVMNYIKPEYNISVVRQVIFKKGWRYAFFVKDDIKDYTYVPFYSDKGFWWNLMHMKFSTIRRYAKKHNPEITEELINDKTIHFMDRI